jgi:hypothetical protein
VKCQFLFIIYIWREKSFVTIVINIFLINAKTGKLLDYVETDKSLLTIFDLQDDVDLIKYMYDYENIVKAGASL